MMLIFEKDIVVAGILIWAFGDGVSAVVGKHYGTIRHPLNTKRVFEGTIAGIIAASIAASFLVYWLYALVASTVAMIVESLEWELYKQPFDDNFFVPIVGSFVIYFLMILF
jgi:dolichol kinase